MSPAFVALLSKLEDGDGLVVTKLDELGRSAIDVRAAVEALRAGRTYGGHELGGVGFAAQQPIGWRCRCLPPSPRSSGSC